MNALPPARPLSSVVAVPARAGAGATGLAIVSWVLVWAVGTPVACVSSLRAAASTGFDELLPAAAGAIAWCGLLWFAALVGVEIASTWPGLIGQLFSRVATHCAPRGLRTAARWLAGVTLVAAPLCSATAVAMAATNATPNLDRPVATATASPGGLDLDRPHGQSATAAPSSPATPYVPKPPPAAVRIAAPNGTELMTGTPHRDVDHEGGYVVRRGDALWDIAARHLGADATAADVAREWPRWYTTNRAVIGADPNLLRPGEVLYAPPP